MIQRSDGFTLPLILLISIVVVLFSSAAYYDNARSLRALNRANERQRLIELNARLDKIFSTPDLCTCNFRNFVRPVGGDIIIDSAATPPYRTTFGFYELNGNDRGNLDTFCGRIHADDVVLNTAGSFHIPPNHSTLATQAVIENFRLQENEAGGGQLYRATFRYKLNGLGNSEIANQEAPIELDLYLSIYNNVIQHCYKL